MYSNVTLFSTFHPFLGKSFLAITSKVTELGILHQDLGQIYAQHPRMGTRLYPEQIHVNKHHPEPIST
jgi:hypothetical protein